MEDRQKRVQSLWGQMNTVLKQISKQRDAAHFLTPVDAEKLKARHNRILLHYVQSTSVFVNNANEQPVACAPLHITRV